MIIINNGWQNKEWNVVIILLCTAECVCLVVAHILLERHIFRFVRNTSSPSLVLMLLAVNLLWSFEAEDIALKMANQMNGAVKENNGLHQTKYERPPQKQNTSHHLETLKCAAMHKKCIQITTTYQRACSCSFTYFFSIDNNHKWWRFRWCT